MFDEGCVLHADKRTYLDLTAVEKLMEGDQAATISLLDKLIVARVIYRGFVLGCNVCKHVEWYSLAELADEFQCRRCGRKQMIGHQHWKHPAAPQVFYKLDEIVYQFLKNDGDVVTLSLDHMLRASKLQFNYCTEVEFRNKNSELIGEIDFCAVWNGLLTIGEAKKNSGLLSASVAEKYAHMATILYARQVCFCTMSPQWKSSTVERVQGAFQGKLAAPVFLAADELLGS